MDLTQSLQTVEKRGVYIAKHYTKLVLFLLPECRYGSPLECDETTCFLIVRPKSRLWFRRQTTAPWRSRRVIHCFLPLDRRRSPPVSTLASNARSIQHLFRAPPRILAAFTGQSYRVLLTRRKVNVLHLPCVNSPPTTSPRLGVPSGLYWRGRGSGLSLTLRRIDEIVEHLL